MIPATTSEMTRGWRILPRKKASPLEKETMTIAWMMKRTMGFVGSNAVGSGCEGSKMVALAALRAAVGAAASAVVTTCPATPVMAAKGNPGQHPLANRGERAGLTRCDLGNSRTCGRSSVCHRGLREGGWEVRGVEIEGCEGAGLEECSSLWWRRGVVDRTGPSWWYSCGAGVTGSWW